MRRVTDHADSQAVPVPAVDPHEDTFSALARAGFAGDGLPLRLHLGCGQQILPGYVNIDFPQRRHSVMVVRPDLEADVTALRFPPGSVGEVRLHHVFEHFNRVVALGLLIRWHEWLRPGGVLLIETPDFLATAEAALRSSGPSRVGLVRHLEGDHSDDWAYHVGQWYPERFERTLSGLGFDEVSTERYSTAAWHDPPLHNVVAHAVKVNDIPQAELLRRADVLLRESLVAESEAATWAKWCEQLREFIRSGTVGTPAAHAALRAPG